MKIYTYHINRGWAAHQIIQETKEFLLGYSNINTLCLEITPPKIKAQSIQIYDLSILNKILNLEEAKTIFQFTLYQDQQKIGHTKVEIKPEELSKINYEILPIDIIIDFSKEITTSPLFLTIECSLPEAWIKIEDPITPHLEFSLKRSEYEIIKKINIDTIYSISKVKAGENIYLEKLNQIGYTHTGWLQEKENQSEKFKFDNNQDKIEITDINSNITYVAIWEPKIINLSFTSEGLSSNFSYNIEAKINDKIKQGAIPPIDGYEFLGWKNNSSDDFYIIVEITEEYFTNNKPTNFIAQYRKIEPAHFLTLQFKSLKVGEKTEEKSFTYDFMKNNSKIFLPANYYAGENHENYYRIQYWKNQNTYFSPYIGYNYENLLPYANSTFEAIGFDSNEGDTIGVWPLFVKGENNQWIPINNIYEKGESE